MGYFLDYELFQPCSNCGRTECNGNECRAPRPYDPHQWFQPTRPTLAEMALEARIERAVKAELDRREKGDTR